MRAWWLYVLALLLMCCALLAPTAFANGGEVRVSNAPAGPYAVTVFTSPTPFRAGPVDISVYVAEGQNLAPVEDAQVTVTVEPIGHAGAGGSYPATHEQATNKLFYAAKFTLPSDGQWRVTVDVDGPLGSGSTAFELEAGGASRISGPLLIVLLVLVPLGIAWRLAQAQRQRLRPAAQPPQEQP
jgi:hypothetical protein